MRNRDVRCPGGVRLLTLASSHLQMLLGAPRGEVVSVVLSVLAGMDGVRLWQEDLYRDLHQHPELSHQKHVTGEKNAAHLRQIGYQVHTGVGRPPATSPRSSSRHSTPAPKHW